MFRIFANAFGTEDINIIIEVPKPDTSAVDAADDVLDEKVIRTWKYDAHQKAVYEQFVQKVKKMLEEDLKVEILLYEESTSFKRIDGETYQSLSRYIYFKNNKKSIKKCVIIITLRVMMITLRVSTHDVGSAKKDIGKAHFDQFVEDFDLKTPNNRVKNDSINIYVGDTKFDTYRDVYNYIYKIVSHKIAKGR